MKSRAAALLSVFLICSVFIWSYVVLPLIQPSYTNHFPFKYKVHSVDDFYSEETHAYTGEQASKTTFSYDATPITRTASEVRVTFNVTTLDGKPIVNIKRSYGISQPSGAHIQQSGDKPRNGYLFAPADLEEGQSFYYWHINYNAPAHMKYTGKTTVQGIETYMYQTTYEHELIDQTSMLGHLPGVPDKRTVRLEPTLTLWIEPKTGLLINYTDDTIAYYYDKNSGQKLFPWNHFSNTFTTETIEENIALANRMLFAIRMQQTGVPVILVFFSLICAVYAIKPFRFTCSQKQIFYTILAIADVVGIGGLVVIAGWLFNIDSLKRLLPGLVTMKFTTALSFLFTSGLLAGVGFKTIRKEDLALILLPSSSLVIIIIMGLLFLSTTSHLDSGVKTRIIIGSAVGVISICAISGYILDDPFLYYLIEGVSAGMALHTSILFFLTSLGLVVAKTCIFNTIPEQVPPQTA